MIVIANLFLELQTVKELVRPRSKKRRLRRTFHIQHDKVCKERMKSAWKNFYHIFSSLCEKLIWKIYPLVICEILGVSGETLTAKQKYPVWDFENLTSPIQMELSEERKHLVNFLFNFWNLHLILNILKKKMIFVANLFLILRTGKDLVRQSTC